MKIYLPENSAIMNAFSIYGGHKFVPNFQLVHLGKLIFGQLAKIYSLWTKSIGHHPEPRPERERWLQAVMRRSPGISIYGTILSARSVCVRTGRWGGGAGVTF